MNHYTQQEILTARLNSLSLLEDLDDTPTLETAEKAIRSVRLLAGMLTYNGRKNQAEEVSGARVSVAADMLRAVTPYSCHENTRTPMLNKHDAALIVGLVIPYVAPDEYE